MPDMTDVINAAKGQLDYIESRLRDGTNHRDKLFAEAERLSTAIAWLKAAQEFV